MRDIVFLLAFAALFILAIKRPYISLSLWLWSGLFVPVYWLHGIAQSISYNTVFAACTIIGYLIYRNKSRVPPNALLVLPLLFLAHTTLTSIVTIGIEPYVWLSWENFLKVMLLFLFASLILRQKHQFELFIWVIVLSVGFIGFVEGLKFLASGGGHSIKGPRGHILSDNNHFALALCMTLPLIIYLITVTPKKFLKIGLIGVLILCTLAVLGTHSRGGFIGLAVVGSYFWLKSHKKLLSLLLVVIIGTLAIQFLPESWYERMDSVESVEKVLEDDSFNTRLNAWKIHTLMAIERPLVGGGFGTPQYGYVWRSLAVDIHIFDFIPTPPPSERGWAAHSIYFQVLGDHGFPGLLLFLLILLITFRRLSHIEKYYNERDQKQGWQYTLARMIKVSIFVYCIGGAALSLAYIELLYALVAITYGLYVSIETSQEQETRARRGNRLKGDRDVMAHR
ncbi:putative O-glycosylation ligase, exosortase A system-associated [Vibrio hannami]|uniref:putative O-glycosylation ligase, exosortase A system-associated n=1 Tax=Vibrio hannami TaxID=2717094 RepID=UPI00240E9EEC|nr:putative O-glycosylation ligase, exosortase A system-associated [Vibrio hannami]MDG3088278.1 putative O-glycosylation ligase, exosortase A system-associated [Vibrio hannami]